MLSTYDDERAARAAMAEGWWPAARIAPLGEGHIHATWLVDPADVAHGRAVLQRISTAVFAEDAGGDVDERSPVHTTGNPGILLEGEQRVRDAGGVVIRLAGIYGPGRDRIVRMVRDGSARCAHPPPIGNRIHQRDCAGAVDRCPAANHAALTVPAGRHQRDSAADDQCGAALGA